ncbi:MAG: hypothetical protein ACKN9S_14715 [Pirellula sp.]
MTGDQSKDALGAGTVVGIGTDIIECERIAAMEQKHGEEFLHRVFTEREIAYCGDRKMSEVIHERCDNLKLNIQLKILHAGIRLEPLPEKKHDEPSPII